MSADSPEIISSPAVIQKQIKNEKVTENWFSKFTVKFPDTAPLN